MIANNNDVTPVFTLYIRRINSNRCERSSYGPILSRMIRMIKLTYVYTDLTYFYKRDKFVIRENYPLDRPSYSNTRRSIVRRRNALEEFPFKTVQRFTTSPTRKSI